LAGGKAKAVVRSPPPDNYEELLRLWVRSARAFILACLIIKDKRGRLVPLRLNAPQEKLLTALLRYVRIFVLKARKEGVSTLVAAVYFWQAAIHRKNVLVVAHKKKSAEQIFRIYATFYRHLPEWLRAEIPTTRGNVRQLVFAHGGRIEVTTARSDEARSDTYQFIHASEVALWPHLNESVAAIFATGDITSTQTVLETTAKGPNEAYHLWNSTGDYRSVGKSIHRIFFAWFEDPTAESDVPPGHDDEESGDWVPCDLDVEEEAYVERYGLSERKINWMWHTLHEDCLGNWDTFNQEHPAEPHLAFILGGSPYFSAVARKVGVDPLEVAKLSAGLQPVIWREPQPYHIYTMGVDTGTGDPDQDASTAVIRDVTNKNNQVVVAAIEHWVTEDEHAAAAFELGSRYNAFAVIEANSCGHAVCNYFKRKGYPHMYRRKALDNATGELTEKMGFYTGPGESGTRSVLLSTCHRDLSKGRLEVTDPRIQAQINSFQYNARGRPEAASGCHDDLIFALALSGAGEDDVEHLRNQRATMRRPRTLEEAIAFEQATKMPFSRGIRFADDPVRRPSPSRTMRERVRRRQVRVER